jgi:preprotein translocase subunit SecG
MFTVVIILIIIVSLLLMLVVLAQNSKGGVGSQFGGSAASQVMGVKKTSDFLEKLTWGLAIVLMILTVSTKFMINDPLQDAGITSPNIERARQQAIPSFDNSNAIPPADSSTENPFEGSTEETSEENND